MKYYSHNIGDFDKATRHLTRIERSVYRDLIDLYYDTEAQLPLDKAWLCRKILARSNEEATGVEQVLNEFFTETPTGWFHERCEAELEVYWNSNSQRSQAGKASAAAKALKKQQALNATSTTVATPVTTTEPTGVEQTCNDASTIQEPITNNQETKKKTKAPAAPSPVFVLPDWIDQTVWDTWHSTPKRKKATPEQKALAVKTLSDMRDAGIDHAAALRNSAVAGWQGLFIPDQKSSQSTVNKQQALEQRNRSVGQEWAREMEERHAAQ